MYLIINFFFLVKVCYSRDVENSFSLRRMKKKGGGMLKMTLLMERSAFLWYKRAGPYR